MLTPLIGLILGIVVLSYAVLVYRGSPVLRSLPPILQQKGNRLWALGTFAIALGLMLGFLGYLGYMNALWLRQLRLLLGSVGVLMLGYRLFKIILVGDRASVTFSDHTNDTLTQVRRYWELLSVLVPQNLYTRYRGSFLGVYWSLLNPLIMMGIYTLIFGKEFASYYDNSVLNYILAAFTGLVVTNFYSSSTSQALASVVNNGSLLNKIRLPIGVFPISMIASNLFQFTVGVLPLLAIVTLIVSKNLLNVFALLLPLFSLALVCTGVGFLVSALYVFFRDLGYFYELVCFVLWISSPVFYPAEIVPESVKPILGLNPLVQIIESLRQISLSGSLPDLSYIGSSVLSGLIILILGWTFFQWLRPQFMDLL